jgi:predicted AAA+ superfamily ATPase
MLEATYLFERLPAYTASHTTRLVKSPKAFWNDPGLAIFLSGYYAEESLRQASDWAPISRP